MSDDVNKDGVLDKAEINEIYKNAFINLKDYNFLYEYYPNIYIILNIETTIIYTKR